MRRLTRTCGLILVSALLATAGAATVAFASQTADPGHAALQVYGDRTVSLQRGIAYWNHLAGRAVIHYAGPRLGPAAADDPHTVVVMIDALTDKSGVTAGIVGRTPQAITIDPRYMLQWVVYAHEFGHALGFHHDNGPGYDGAMADASMWDPNPNADRLLIGRQRA